MTRTGVAGFDRSTVGDACTDALLAFRLGVEGMREVVPSEFAEPGRPGKGPMITNISPVPRGWKLDRAKAGPRATEALLAEWERGIAETRACLGRF